MRDSENRMKSLWRLLWSPLRAPIKGALGEAAVNAGAALTLPSSVYRRFHNVMLRTVSGTTQIDHVLVSVFGVFVVETKNMAGWIFGGERDRQWTQVFPGGRRYTFQNPLRQNYGHVRAMEDTLAGIALPRGVVRSVIVFVGNAELKREMPENVMVGFDGARYIRSFRNKVLSERQVAEICSVIEDEALAGASRQHIQNLKRRRSGSTPRQCPRCGRRMVLRTAKRGPGAGKRFWGCEGFPACRMVEKAE